MPTRSMPRYPHCLVKESQTLLQKYQQGRWPYNETFLSEGKDLFIFFCSCLVGVSPIVAAMSSMSCLCVLNGDIMIAAGVGDRDSTMLQRILDNFICKN